MNKIQLNEQTEILCAADQAKQKRRFLIDDGRKEQSYMIKPILAGDGLHV